MGQQKTGIVIIMVGDGRSDGGLEPHSAPKLGRLYEYKGIAPHQENGRRRVLSRTWEGGFFCLFL